MVDAREEERLSDSQMTFGEHLDELRARLFKSIIASLVGLAIMLFFQEPLMRFVTAPYREATRSIGLPSVLNVFGVADSFFAHMKLAFFAGVILTAPIWIYQMWAFISAGLYNKERSAVLKFVPFCVLLFLGGVLFGYFIMVPLGLSYLMTYGDPTLIKPTIGIKQYLSIFFVLTLVQGFAFQLPLVMVGLARAGLVQLNTLREKRRWTILVIFVMAAILTPPDPVTQCLLALPLVLLYEVGIYLSWIGMGADRPKLNYGAAWPTVRKILVVILVAFLLRHQLVGIWKGGQIKDRVYGATTERLDVVALTRDLIGCPVTFAMRCSEKGPVAYMAVLADKKPYFVELHSEIQHTMVTSVGRNEQGEATLRALSAAEGNRVLHLHGPKSYPANLIVPGLLEALRHGDDTTRESAQQILVHLTGEGKGLDTEDALEALEAWWESHPDATFEQEIKR